MPIYLGLDSSTQSLSAVAIEVAHGPANQATQRLVLGDYSIHFDSELPHHGTKNGVLPSDDPQVAHSSPLLWAEALDLLFKRLRDRGLDLSRVQAIAGSGQQHGSVYVSSKFTRALENLNGGLPLAEQIGGCFSRATAPI